MQNNSRITVIFERARRAHVSPEDVSGAAGVHKATLYRWRKGPSGPRLRQVEAMEAFLDDREAALVAELAGGRAA